MKNIKRISSFVLSLAIMFTFGVFSAYAEEGQGWIEVSVSVPEGFTDQIYIQFQEEGKYDEAFYGNTVQVLPDNGYIGRIQVPAGNYEVTMANSYENPLIYEVSLSSETPITVKANTAATLVEFDCYVVPIEKLPAIKGEYPQEILDAAQATSDRIANENKDTEIKEENPENTVPADDDKEDNKENQGPLVKIFKNILMNAVFFVLLGGIGAILLLKRKSSSDN